MVWTPPTARIAEVVEMGNERWHGRRGIDDGIRRQYQGAGFAWSQAPECRACDQNTAWRTPPRVKGRCTPGLTPGPLTRQTLSSTWSRSRHQALKCPSWKIACMRACLTCTWRRGGCRTGEEDD